MILRGAIFDIAASGLATRYTEVSMATKKSAKEVEGVASTTTSTTLTMRLDAVVTVAVVDLSKLGIA